MAQQNKEDRINFRVSAAQKALISRAAALKKTSVTNFIVDTACEAAQEMLAEQRHFELTEEQWNAFCAALDAPPKEIPQLRMLLEKPSVFRERTSKKADCD